MKTRIFFAASVLAIALLMVSALLAADEDLTGEVEDFVKKVADAKGVNKGEITGIREVNFSDTPDEINIENIDENNLAIYEINQQGEQSTFVITFSKEGLESFSREPVYYTTSFLTFGMEDNNGDSSFMDTASGVSGSLNSGYVMIRSGSITGIATSLEITKADSNYIEIIIHKNREAIGFGNIIFSSSEGYERDYDIQSRDVVTFKPGDIISVYAKTNKNEVRDVTTLIELTTEN